MSLFNNDNYYIQIWKKIPLFLLLHNHLIYILPPLNKNHRTPLFKISNVDFETFARFLCIFFFSPFLILSDGTSKISGFTSSSVPKLVTSKFFQKLLV
jgi:hypothetical protein